MSRTSDTRGRTSGWHQGAPETLLVSPRSYSAWWGRTQASSTAGGLTAGVSSTLGGSRSLIAFAIEVQGSAAAVGPSPAWCVSTMSETSGGGFVRFNQVGSWSVGSYAAGSAGLGWSAVVMWTLSNPRTGRAQT